MAARLGKKRIERGGERERMREGGEREGMKMGESYSRKISSGIWIR